jgi:uncharacterized repeat protein (TIGR01451 family)
MRIDGANKRSHAPRLLGAAVLGFAALLIALLGSSGGAGAAPGPTDLSITKTDSPDPVVQGNNLTYTIQVTNPNPSGGNDASDVVVTDNLPSGVDFVSATGGTCTHSGGTVTCNLGQVNAATTATVTIIVKTKNSGTLTNTASVASSTVDAVLSNNSATATTTVNKKAGNAPKKKGKKKGKASCAVPTISGTAGNDVITGTSRGDVIVTFGGDDQVFAGGGGDLVCTDGGADLVSGQDGGDTVIGGGGPDRLIGGKSGDLLKGKAGRDRLKGKSGNDTLNGGKNRDKCKGGSGQDTLIRCP